MKSFSVGTSIGKEIGTWIRVVEKIGIWKNRELMRMWNAHSFAGKSRAIPEDGYAQLGVAQRVAPNVHRGPSLNHKALRSHTIVGRAFWEAFHWPSTGRRRLSAQESHLSGVYHCTRDTRAKFFTLRCSHSGVYTRGYTRGVLTHCARVCCQQWPGGLALHLLGCSWTS